MSVTQVVRDSTVVEHAKVAAQQKRRMFVVQLEVNAYDESSSKLRPGLTRILEGIEEAGWRLDLITPSEGGEGAAARLFIFRPDPGQAKDGTGGHQPAQQQEQSGQQQPYQQHPTGGQPQYDPYGGYGQQQQQQPGYAHPGYNQQYPGYDPYQYPGYGQPGYGQQYPGYGQQGW